MRDTEVWSLTPRIRTRERGLPFGDDDSDRRKCLKKSLRISESRFVGEMLKQNQILKQLINFLSYSFDSIP